MILACWMSPNHCRTTPRNCGRSAFLLAEVTSQAVLVAKLRHQLAGPRAHRFGPSSETPEQLQLALQMSEIAIAARPPGCACPMIPRRQAKAQADPRSHSACRGRTCTGRRRMCPVWWQAASVGRRCDRGDRVCARPLCREPDRAAPDGLLGMRLLHASPAAKPPDRTRASRSGPSRPCSGQQIRGSSAAVSAKPDLRARRARHRPLDIDRSTLAARHWPLDTGRLAGQIHRPAGTAGRCHPLPGRRLQAIAERAAACTGGSGDLCR